ncbi:hypothetical protein BDR05DRAFT_952345 [Suillus weaverae]|nr:hypothetical protein BDR05DRAFT_952345 [Suillus weaverae]
MAFAASIWAQPCLLRFLYHSIYFIYSGLPISTKVPVLWPTHIYQGSNTMVSTASIWAQPCQLRSQHHVVSIWAHRLYWDQTASGPTSVHPSHSQESQLQIQHVEIRSSVNAVSLGHMANTMNTFHWTSKIIAFDPPVNQLTSHPYGQLPTLWLPCVDDVPQGGEPSVSTIGRQLTTTWDESWALVATTLGDTSASAVHPSGDGPQVLQLSSAPSGSLIESE